MLPHTFYHGFAGLYGHSSRVGRMGPNFPDTKRASRTHRLARVWKGRCHSGVSRCCEPVALAMATQYAKSWPVRSDTLIRASRQVAQIALTMPTPRQDQITATPRLVRLTR